MNCGDHAGGSRSAGRLVAPCRISAGGAHELQHGAAGEQADDGQRRAAQHRHGQRRVHLTVDGVDIARAVALRDHDARAAAQADERADQQLHERAGRADGGQRFGCRQSCRRSAYRPCCKAAGTACRTRWAKKNRISCRGMDPVRMAFCVAAERMDFLLFSLFLHTQRPRQKTLPRCAPLVSRTNYFML